MRLELLDQHVNSLYQVLGGIRPLVPVAELQRLYGNRDYTGVVGFVRDTMGLRLRIRVGYANSGGPKTAPAWVELPKAFPIIGSPAFKNMTVTMYIRKRFIEEAPFASFVAAVAHEMSHVLLGALQNPLAANEEATDLTAMMMGFSEFYVQGSLYLKKWSLKQPRPIGGTLDTVLDELLDWSTFHHLGYLSPEEVVIAAEGIKRMWVRQTMGV